MHFSFAPHVTGIRNSWICRLLGRLRSDSIHHVTLTLYPDGSFKRVVKKEPYAPGGVCSSPDGSPTENSAGAFDETNLQYIEPAVYCGLYKYEAKAGRAGQDHISLAEAPVLESGEFPSDKLTYRSVALCPESHYIADDAQGMGFIFATPGPLRTTGDAPASGGGVGGASPPFRLSVDQLTPSSPTKAPEIESSDGDSFMVKLMAAQSGGGGGGGSSSMVAGEKVVEIDDEDAQKE